MSEEKNKYQNVITRDCIGLVLAAGYGTRLKPYTTKIPKPLLPFCGSPIMRHAIYKLASSGIEEIVINTHHLHELIEDFIRVNYLSCENKDISGDTGDKSIQGPRIYLSYEEELLGTGGVYTKIKDRIQGKNVVVYNSDIVSDIDTLALILSHKSNPSRISTMAVTDYKEGTTPLYVGEDGNLIRIGDDPEEGTNSDLIQGQKCSFCAISLVTSRLLSFLPSSGYSSIIDAYKQALKEGLTVGTYYHDGFWEDIGDMLSYRQAYVKLFSYFKKTRFKNIEIYMRELGL